MIDNQAWPELEWLLARPGMHSVEIAPVGRGAFEVMIRMRHSPYLVKGYARSPAAALLDAAEKYPINPKEAA